VVRKNARRFGEQGNLLRGARTRRRRTLPRTQTWRFKMKMVKSLLLGSAAALVAASGVQAADLPVKAKPVEYVKVCSLYGAAYYYIPGTDICLKLGGYVRYQINENTGTSQSGGPTLGAGGYQNRNVADRSQRARALITVDT